MGAATGLDAVGRLLDHASVLGGLPWSLQRLPAGTAFLRFDVPPPYGVVLMPARRRWRLIIDTLGERAGEGLDVLVAPLRTDPASLIVRVTTLIGVAATDAGRNQDSAGAIVLGELSHRLARRIGDASLGAMAADIVGSAHLRRGDSAEALRWLRGARNQFLRVDDLLAREAEAKLRSARAVLGSASAYGEGSPEHQPS
ncbi:hypothetical protein WDJ51_05400 [Rathayibacter sp. YIM 133350]|uniref:hypothetical protein n=1 Tax=Rathayibacter sp. YIM 133350 TaxID=3131992 RepID=UPI00307F8A75